MNAAPGWSALSPLPYTPQHVAALVELEQRDALTNYRLGWHALAACGINPDNPHDRFQLAHAATESAVSVIQKNASRRCPCAVPSTVAPPFQFTSYIRRLEPCRSGASGRRG